MKHALIQRGPASSPHKFTTTITTTRSPQPSDLRPQQLLIHVVVAGTNPKDWKSPVYLTEHPFHQDPNPESGPDSTTGGSNPAAGSNTGDDLAGTVIAVGSSVRNFKLGDRVAALHELRTPWGSFAEYAIAWESTTFHIPERMSFEEAATVPLACFTAAIAVFRELRVEWPWMRVDGGGEGSKGEELGGAGGGGVSEEEELHRAAHHGMVVPVKDKGDINGKANGNDSSTSNSNSNDQTPTQNSSTFPTTTTRPLRRNRRTPIIVNGASTAVGAFAIKWLLWANIHPIIAIAGAGCEFVRTKLSLDHARGDVVVDYRLAKGDGGVLQDMVRSALCQSQHPEETTEPEPEAEAETETAVAVHYILDTISSDESYPPLLPLLAPYSQGRLAFLLPGKPYPSIPPFVSWSVVKVSGLHAEPGTPDLRHLGAVLGRLLEVGLREGWMWSHPWKVVEGGLRGVQEALQRLRDGRNSAVKYVLRVAGES